MIENRLTIIRARMQIDRTVFPFQATLLFPDHAKPTFAFSNENALDSHLMGWLNDAQAQPITASTITPVIRIWEIVEEGKAPYYKHIFAKKVKMYSDETTLNHALYQAGYGQAWHMYNVSNRRHYFVLRQAGWFYTNYQTFTQEQQGAFLHAVQHQLGAQVVTTQYFAGVVVFLQSATLGFSIYESTCLASCYATQFTEKMQQSTTLIPLFLYQTMSSQLLTTKTSTPLVISSFHITFLWNTLREISVVGATNNVNIIQPQVLSDKIYTSDFSDSSTDCMTDCGLRLYIGINGGFKGYDINDPRNPYQVGECGSQTDCTNNQYIEVILSLECFNGFLYASTPKGVYFFQISQSSDCRTENYTMLPSNCLLGYIYSLILPLEYNYAFASIMSTTNNESEIISIIGPPSPVNCAANSLPLNITFAGTLSFQEETSQLFIGGKVNSFTVDIQNLAPTNPVQIPNNMTYVRNFAFQSGYMYIAYGNINYNTGLQVLNATSPYSFIKEFLPAINAEDFMTFVTAKSTPHYSIIYLVSKSFGLYLLNGEPSQLLEKLGEFANPNFFSGKFTIHKNCGYLHYNKCSGCGPSGVLVLKGIGLNESPRPDKSIGPIKTYINQPFNFTLSPNNLANYFSGIDRYCDILTTTLNETKPVWMQCYPADCNPSLENELTITGTPPKIGIYTIRFSLCNPECTENNLTINIFHPTETIHSIPDITTTSPSENSGSTLSAKDIASIIIAIFAPCAPLIALGRCWLKWKKQKNETGISFIHYATRKCVGIFTHCTRRREPECNTQNDTQSLLPQSN